MKQRIKITENTLRKIIRESIDNVLFEANNNYPFNKFVNDMKMLGFEYRRGEGSSIVF